jgi:hypothetical protein
MSEPCSCGAQPPPDARFCHKCGKPLGVLPAVEESSEEPRAEAQAPPPALRPAASPSFHNPVAVRLGLAMASLAALLSWLPFFNLGFLLWWTAAGFFAALLYRRRTGQLLTVRGGLRLGWITGILTFVIMTVLLTVSIVPLAMSRGGLGAMFQQQIRSSMPAGDPNVQEMLHIFETPAGVATLLFFVLFLFFFLITLLATVGGALGAKVSGRGD